MDAVARSARAITVVRVVVAGFLVVHGIAMQHGREGWRVDPLP